MNNAPVKTKPDRNRLDYTISALLADFIFPRECQSCERYGATVFVGSHYQSFCRACADSLEALRALEFPPDAICPKCGQQHSGAELCVGCLTDPFELRHLRSIFLFRDTIAHAIKSLKYARKRNVAADLALLTYLSIEPNCRVGRFAPPPAQSIFPIHDWNLLAVIPSTDEAISQRGFCHASLIGRNLARRLRLPFLADLIRPRRKRVAQAGLNISQRLKNSRNSFFVEPDSVRGKSILLVDDLLTSGATIRAVASALKSAGAQNVDGVTVARSEFFTRHRSSLFELKQQKLALGKPSSKKAEELPQPGAARATGWPF